MNAHDTPETIEESVPAPASLHDLLAETGEVAPPVEPPSGEDTTEDPQDASGDAEKASGKFNDLAGTLDIELNDLYALTVTFDDGSEKTIEELKDMARSQDDIALRELEFAESKGKQEQALIKAQNELAAIIDGLPKGALNEQTLAKVRENQQQHINREMQMTLQQIPSWQDENTRTSELTGMAQYLEGFGFPRDYLANVVDHRQYAFIRQAWTREQDLQNALAKVRPGSPGHKPSNGAANNPPSRQAPVKRDNNARNPMQAFFNQVE